MRRLLCLMLGVLLSCAQLLAQNRTISGRVTDVKDGSPVPNVSVTVRDGQGGTQTYSCCLANLHCNPCDFSMKKTLHGPEIKCLDERILPLYSHNFLKTRQVFKKYLFQSIESTYPASTVIKYIII